MRREAAVAVLAGALTLGTACAGDTVDVTRCRHAVSRWQERRRAPGRRDRMVAPSAVASCFRRTIRGTRTSRRSRSIPNSTTLINSCGGSTRRVHPDFGTVWDGAPNGIPYVLVGGTQPKVPVSFDYADESDPGPYPIPANAPIEGGPNGTGDRHVMVIDTIAWKLYETFDSHPLNGGTSWHAGSGATWDLSSNALRPAGWTSADAAGLPIFPGLVRYDEAVIKGAINHALRFTCPTTRKAYISPARHWASSQTSRATCRWACASASRRTSTFSTYPAEVRVILTALKKYGMFLADNGSGWYISGAPDSRWSDDNLAKLGQLTAANFELVKMGTIVAP